MTLSAQVRNILPLNGPSNSSIFTSLVPQTTSLTADQMVTTLSSMPRHLLLTTIHPFLQPTLDMSMLRHHSQGQDDTASETQVRVQYILMPDLVERAPRFPSLLHFMTLIPGNVMPLSYLAFSFGTPPIAWGF
jgi:hypothetical protein